MTENEIFRDITLIESVSLDKLLDVFRSELPVYGDFLRYFTISLGELPYEHSTSLLEIGALYEDLKNIVESMLSAYIELGLFRSGYINTDILEIYIEEQEWIETFNDIEKIKKEDVESLVIEYIDDILNGRLEPVLGVNDYVNLENINECLKVLILTEFPNRFSFEKDFIVTSKYSENSIDKWIEELNRPPSIFGEQWKCRISKFIVVDPLLYKLSKKAVYDLKERVKNKVGHDIVYHVEEFLTTFLPDKQLFDEEWQQKREEVVKNLKRKYPFLSIHDEICMIRFAEEELKSAIGYFSAYGSELPERICLEIIGKACRAIESILGVMYHFYKREISAGKTFGELLNNLRGDIVEEYGEDIYKDLEFIRRWRNAVAHPQLLKGLKISREDVIKVLKKAEMFFELFKSKIKLSRDYY